MLLITLLVQPDPSIPGEARVRPRSHVWLAGILTGDLTVLFLYALGALMVAKGQTLGFLGLPSFFLVPAVGGIVATYVWRALSPTIGATLLNTFWMTLLAFLGAALAFR